MSNEIASPTHSPPLLFLFWFDLVRGVLRWGPCRLKPKQEYLMSWLDKQLLSIVENGFATVLLEAKVQSTLQFASLHFHPTLFTVIPSSL